MGDAVEAVVGFAGELHTAMTNSSGGESAESSVAALGKMPREEQDYAR